MTMFCPNCGSPDQSPETYCRNCGKHAGFPIQQFRLPIKVNIYYFFANIVIAGISAFVCLLLLVSNWLCALAGPDCSSRIDPYSFLVFIGLINVGLLISTIIMMIRYSKKSISRSLEVSKAAEGRPTSKLIGNPELEHSIPRDFSAETTKDLQENLKR